LCCNLIAGLFSSKFTQLSFFTLQNQIYREITYTLKSVPTMGFLTSIAFLLEVNGYSKLYDSVDETKFGKQIAGFCYVVQLFNFVLFLRMCRPSLSSVCWFDVRILLIMLWFVVCSA